MAHLAANDGHGLRRFKTNDPPHQLEGAPWDSASTAANNTPMAPVSVGSVATSSPANNSSNASELRPNRFTACGCKCNRNNPNKATPTNSAVGEANAPQAPCDGAVKTNAPPLC